jgi:hypothetical protein
MKKDLDQKIKNIHGKVTLNPDGTESTLGFLAAVALSSHFQEEKIGVEEKLKRGALSHQLIKGGTQDLKPEDIVLIKKCIGMITTPDIIFTAFTLLDA